MKPLGKVKLEWSPEFAYAIGLIVTDGSLSKDGRHIVLTSKDEEMMHNFQKALGIKNNIGKKSSGSQKEKKYFITQIGDVLFYKFLESIGLEKNKTKTIGAVSVPDKYFPDFLRGHFDGDGCIYSYWDPRWRSSFMYYVTFVSASKNHIKWLREEINRLYGIKGHCSDKPAGSVYQLKYAKKESNTLLKNIYYNSDALCLSRKHLKIKEVLGTIEKL
jgi:hypothetical protein